MIPLRRIATAASGIDYSSSLLISSNDKYYVYGSSFCLYLYEIPEMKQTEFICQGYDKFRMIRLSPTEYDIAFILNASKKMYFFNLITHQITDYIGKIEYPITDIQYTCDGLEIIISCATISVFHIVNTKTLASEIVQVTAGIPRTFAPIPGQPNTILYSAEEKEIDLIDLESREVTKTNVRATPMCIKFDPLNSSNCMIITRSKKWGYVLISQTIRVITISECRHIKMLSGDWIPSMPGHIITGDGNFGIIYIWSVSSGNLVYQQSIGDSPITNITRISNKDMVIAFGDGSIGIYDCLSKTYKNKVPRAHTNTIFSGAFLPSDPSLFASVSADKRICFWKIPTLEEVQSISLEDSKHALFCIGFSEGGGFIAVGDSEGNIYIHNLKLNKIVMKEKLHSKAVMGISWSPSNPSIIATSSEDHTCKIYDTVKRGILFQITVNAKMRRCRWSPNGKAIGIACANGSVYVRHDDGVYTNVKVSESKVFDVCWSKFDPNKIAAIDDDGGVHLIDLTTRTSISAKEHKGPVRAIEFTSNGENILMTGGHDGMICFWDGNNLNLIKRYICHSSHIYGIFTHPQFPSLAISVSRDCTVRLWSLEHLFPKNKLKMMISEQNFACKISQKDGSENIDKLIRRMSKENTKINFKITDIIHVNDIMRIQKKRINKICQNLPTNSSEIQRLKSAKKVALEAADLSLKCGKLKKYCELMFLCGEYDAAIAVAPSVSYSFWKSLVLAKSKLCEGTEEESDLLIIAGQTEDALESLMKQGLFSIAILLVAGTRDFQNQPSSVSVFNPPEDDLICKYILDSTEEVNLTLYSVVSKMAANYTKEGKPLHAAASFLSIGDVDGCVNKLFMCGELTWCLEISKMAKRKYDFVEETVFKLCTLNGLGKEYFLTLDLHMKKKMVSFLNIKNETELDELFTKCGMKTSEQLLESSRSLKGLSLAKVKMTAGKIEEGLVLLINLAKNSFSNYDFNTLEEIAELIKNCGTSLDTKMPMWYTAVAIVHYVGLYKAFWNGFSTVLSCLQDSFKYCATQSNEQWLIERIEETRLLSVMGMSIKSVPTAEFYAEEWNLKENENVKISIQISKSGNVTGGKTMIVATAGVIPIDIDKSLQYSICTGEPIKENPFILENNRARMTISEALMLFSVSPFSPLPTMKYIIPY
ncbi:hypothetical protein TVAG_065780 [Trichomonas vaginalis G3]|uniref:WD repeat protein n=1 Tax=Trichomonas vaginalis (strain ATCC PRA-98 / G3) TaxID=412133 RepID=A2ELY2_TRIV3|nr:WD repeat-containing protein 17 family [Trichomonas vaginalis G3]EAY06321.1 hypothetical protein TVAG_065780 [Trichomonas vaginalis G3]KAI5489857.1 WD repeat-containing protein 17 family [Trichomonas vaginalis G3]|eukprot:XP_001318544.1 hypothetical protein [Trichomonas vaginalis G3]